MIEIQATRELKPAPKKNRNRLEITQAILDIARDGVRKTRIMHTANLSFKLLEKYVNGLVRAGLLKVREGEKKKTYKTSEKGLQFLREFEALEEYATILATKRHRLDRMLEGSAPAEITVQKLASHQPWSFNSSRTWLD